MTVLLCAAMGRAGTPVTTRPAGSRSGQRAEALAAATRPGADTSPTSRPSIVSFQPGVRINWPRRQVEVNATVILRRGGIELFACSPRVREHESIVRIEARPLHVYQALGLIGLAPGHPIRFNPETEEMQPAEGDPVEIEVRYTVQGTTRQEPIEQWMQPARFAEPAPAAPKPLDALPWVFAGSFPVQDGAIAADIEGTVIAVVDFGSALVALPESHSDSNAELWLEPAPGRIPPEQTSCTLIFRPGPLWLSLGPAGRVRQGARTITLAAVGRAVQAFRRDDPDRRIRVTVDPDCPSASEAALLRLLKSLKVPDEAIIIVRPAARGALKHDPQAAATWVRERMPAAEPANEPEHSWAESSRQLAADLRNRTLDLRARTEIVARHASRLTRDLLSLVLPTRSPASNRRNP